MTRPSLRALSLAGALTLLSMCSTIPEYANSSAPDAAEIRTRSDTFSNAMFKGGVFTFVDAIDGQVPKYGLAHQGEPFMVSPGPHVFKIRSPGPGYAEANGSVRLTVRPRQKLVFQAINVNDIGTVLHVMDTATGKDRLITTQVLDRTGGMPPPVYIPASVYTIH